MEYDFGGGPGPRFLHPLQSEFSVACKRVRSRLTANRVAIRSALVLRDPASADHLSLGTLGPRNRKKEGAVFKGFYVVRQSTFQGDQPPGGKFYGLSRQVEAQLTRESLKRNALVRPVSRHPRPRPHCDQHNSKIRILHQGLRISRRGFPLIFLAEQRCFRWRVKLKQRTSKTRYWMTGSPWSCPDLLGKLFFLDSSLCLAFLL